MIVVNDASIGDSSTFNEFTVVLEFGFAVLTVLVSFTLVGSIVLFIFKLTTGKQTENETNNRKTN